MIGPTHNSCTDTGLTIPLDHQDVLQSLLDTSKDYRDVPYVQNNLSGGYRIRNKKVKRRVFKKASRRTAAREIQLDLFQQDD